MIDVRTPSWRVGAELVSARGSTSEPVGCALAHRWWRSRGIAGAPLRVRSGQARRTLRAGAAVALAVLALSGCTRGSTSSRPPIHLNPNMDDQPRYDAQEASAFFADGKAMREPVPGTVAQGDLADDPVFATGRTAAGEPVARLPVPVDEALLARGEERYGIYCGPCHAVDGSGQSMLQERSGVATADLLQERLIQETDGHLYDVITNGLGLMQGYGYPIEPRDRWAIVAWVRELQRRAGAEPYGGAAGGAADADAAAAPGEGEEAP